MASARMDQKRHAIVREVPDTFPTAIASYFGSGPTDVEAARATHSTYKRALVDNGIEVTSLPADNAHPDCLFIEDQAIVIDGHVLLPVPGEESRRGEQPAVEDILIEHFEGTNVCRMNLPAMMDGGDLLRLGDIFFVGRSTRTNDAGIEELEGLLNHLGYSLRVVDIPSHALHLTSISSTPSDTIILAPEGYLSKDAFGELPDGSEVVWMPEDEVYGCNTIGLPNGKVIVAEGYPNVKASLEERGFETIIIDMDQIRAADGSLTCLSIFI